jgi:hypothetical protein
MARVGADASIHVEVRRMKRLSRWVLFSAVPLFALTVPAAVGKTPTSRVKQTDGRVGGLAFDGSQVVYGVNPDSPPDRRVYVWNVLSGAGRLVHRSGGGAEFAVAGKRIAWIARGGSPSETDEYLLTTPLPRLKLRQVASAVRNTDYEMRTESGDWLSGLVGAGDVIAVSRWQTNGKTVSNARLSLIGTSRLRPIVSGTSAIVAQSVDAGRIAVVRSTALWPSQFARSGGAGSVGIYSTSGKLLLEVNRGSAKEAALSGNSLAVLTTSNRIELYSAKTGSLVRSRRVPAGAAHLDLQARIAIYSVYPLNGHAGPRKLHVLQLKTGKDVVLASGEAPYPYTQGDDAQIDRLGVVYAVNIKAHGKLVFVPMARVLAAVSKGHVR